MVLMNKESSLRVLPPPERYLPGAPQCSPCTRRGRSLWDTPTVGPETNDGVASAPATMCINPITP